MRNYKKLTQPENIFNSFYGFLAGKKKKKDVIEFYIHLEDNLFALSQNLQSMSYQPGGYESFYVRDPKLRLIHKASVRDRIVHRLVSRGLEEIFEPAFIENSYSSRKYKGTHKGVKALRKMALGLSGNNWQTVWALKCDIKKFFASVNHKILLEILSRKIQDNNFLLLIEKIINSFPSGIPIGNLTSQIFSNIYLNELDLFVDQELTVKDYVRYADDFVILSENRSYLESLLPKIADFLKSKLNLTLHPNKTIFRKFRSGIDFLGYIIFPTHILPRTKTKRRLVRKIQEKIKKYKEGKITKDRLNQTIQSYLGYLKHANSYAFRQRLKTLICTQLDK